MFYLNSTQSITGTSDQKKELKFEKIKDHCSEEILDEDSE